MPKVLLLALIGIYFFSFALSVQASEMFNNSSSMPLALPEVANISHNYRPNGMSTIPLEITIPQQSPIPIVNKRKFYLTTYSDKVPFDTHSDRQKLSELKGKKLVLILFEYNNSRIERIVGVEGVGDSTSQIILDYQKKKFLSEFESLFKIEDISNNSQILNEQNSISEILQMTDADGGILITNDYGYRMSGNLLQTLWEMILPWFKHTLRVMFQSNVEDYYLASNTYIIDKEGKVIWNFYGKISASPEVEFTITEIVEGTIGGDPSEQKIIKAMIPITGHYTEYIRWLVETDINGGINKSYNDYPKRNNRILLKPASDDIYLPSLLDAPQRQYDHKTPAFEVFPTIIEVLFIAYLIMRKKVKTK